MTPSRILIAILLSSTILAYVVLAADPIESSGTRLTTPPTNQKIQNITLSEEKAPKLKTKELRVVPLSTQPLLLEAAPELKPANKETSTVFQQPNVALPKPEKLAEPIHPVHQSPRGWYVSVYRPGLISYDLEQKVKKIYREKKNDHFLIEGPLVTELLTALEIKKDQMVFFRIFNKAELGSIPVNTISSLWIGANPAGDDVFGTVGIPVRAADPKLPDSIDPVGIAWIGSNNPLTTDSVSAVKFEPTTPLKSESEILEILRDKYSRITIERLEKPRFQSMRIGKFEFIEAETAYEGIYSGSDSRTQGKLLGYFVKDADRVTPIHDFFIDETYRSKPHKLLLGKLLKNYDQVLFISSSGMGDCGRWVLFKDGSRPIEVELTCGSWGC